jgi:hypothetical protein
MKPAMSSLGASKHYGWIKLAATGQTLEPLGADGLNPNAGRKLAAIASNQWTDQWKPVAGIEARMFSVATVRIN